MGHHPTYYRKFIKGFHDLGCEVLPACSKAALPEVSEWCRDYQDGPTVHSPLRIQPPRRRQSVIPKFLRGYEQSITGFGRLARQLRTWEKRSKRKIDLVFFSAIYDSNFSRFHASDFLFRYPWSGLYLHARAFRMPGSPLPYTNQLPCPAQIFKSRHMSSVCLLDEGVVDAMKELTVHKPVVVLPDFTDTRVSTGEASLAAKVAKLAAGRKIVLCIGSLQRTKGLIELCRAAQDPGLADVFFCFGGETYWEGISASEQAEIRSFWESAPNVFTHLQRFQDERVMNDLVQLSDVVFAAYTDFPNSSNIMTKAAYFEKPLIVSDGFLMAERVRKHRLGRVVPEGSVTDIVQEIKFLCDLKNFSEADYSGYYAKHSLETLRPALSEVIQSIS